MPSNQPTSSLNLARAIRQQLGERINIAALTASGPIVPASFLAGLISVENAALSPLATRFEEAVFAKLQRIRDSILPRSYKGIRRSQIADASDALRNLATSYSFSQIMGWHVLVAPLAQYSVADLRDPVKQLYLRCGYLFTMPATKPHPGKGRPLRHSYKWFSLSCQSRAV